MNKSKKILLFISGWILLHTIDANSQDFNRCGYDHLLQKIEQENPNIKDIIDNTFQSAIRYKEKSKYRDETLEIPVVVHIVYQNMTQEISKKRILDVINRLNEDFSQKNKNAENIRGVFNSVVGNPEIHFNLKAIRRVQTSSVFVFDADQGKFPDNVKESSKGGSDAINPDRFMNIWVCNIRGGSLLGYSYPPACAPHWPAGSTAPYSKLDGVVIYYKAFNINTTYKIPGRNINIDGRTLTHEVGHYLGLRHIWGDGSSVSLGVADCIADDGLSDTPNQGLPSDNNCKYTQNTCTDIVQDKPDMIENYMDYSDELCMSTFTKDQIKVMRSVLMNCRKTLLDTTDVILPSDTTITEKAVLFPNPNMGDFYVELHFTDFTDVNMFLYNNLGQVVVPAKFDVNGNYLSFDINNLPNGIYFLKLEFGHSRVVKRLVLAR